MTEASSGSKSSSHNNNHNYNIIPQYPITLLQTCRAGVVMFCGLVLDSTLLTMHGIWSWHRLFLSLHYAVDHSAAMMTTWVYISANQQQSVYLYEMIFIAHDTVCIGMGDLAEERLEQQPDISADIFINNPYDNRTMLSS